MQQSFKLLLVVLFKHCAVYILPLRSDILSVGPYIHVLRYLLKDFFKIVNKKW